MRNLIADNIFGTIAPPAAIQQYGGIGEAGGGPVRFISNLIILITVAAGVWTVLNVLLAGFALVTSEGDPKKINEMSNKIVVTFIGLLIMVAAPLVAALIGLFFFGSASYFLNPTIVGPGVTP